MRNLFDSIFNKEVPLDISPIKVDSSSMQFNRYILKRSNDGKYLLQIGFTLDIYKELKEKYHSIKGKKALELYLATEYVIQKIELDKTVHAKLSLQNSWENTKSYLSQLVNDLQIENGHLNILLDSDIKDKSIQINKEIGQLFNDGKLLYNLDLSKSQLSTYSITNGLFNKSSETILLVKIIYSTTELEEDIKSIFNQFIFQLVFIIIILGLIYLFILKSIVTPLLRIINHIENNQHSNVDGLKVTEINILNVCYNEMHLKMNKRIEENISLLKDNRRFIADTVHQIRTPLTNIMMNSEMVKKFQTDDSLSTFIDKIDSSINMLSNSYEDLAYITTADTIEYPPSKVDASEMVQKRIRFFTTISKVNHKEIQAEIEEDIFLNINLIELERVIDNNISNGIKYGTKNKPIIINLLRTNDRVTMEFKTFGKPLKNNVKVFDKNYREDEAKRGLGLGLNMVKSICEKNDVTYGATYTDGKNIFTYTFEAL